MCFIEVAAGAALLALWRKRRKAPASALGASLRTLGFTNIRSRRLSPPAVNSSRK